MNILHLADTHLGYSAYRKVTQDGINQREADIYQSFTKIIDYAIDQDVDLVVHAGDLFDSVRPNNRAISIALNQMIRLSKNNIPIVIIAGNHEQPKLQETGHIFNLFEHIPHIYPIFHERYETKEFMIDDENILIHCLPQINTQDVLQEQLTFIERNEKMDYNIFLAHGSIQGIKEFSMNEFNEMMLPKQYLSEKFDYVALGHYHIQTKIDDYMYYAGSTDTFSFSESNKDHGFMELTLNNPKKNVEFMSINTRPFIDTPSIECYGKNIEEIMKEIIQTIKKIEPIGKIFRINLEHILSHQYRGLDFRMIRQLCQGCLHYDISAYIEEQDRKRMESQGRIDSLTKEYTHFIKEQELEEKELILKKGLEYINNIGKKDDL